LIALPVLVILGIFSAKYRQLAKESFRCVFTTITFRPCDASVDQKIRAQVTASLARTSKPLARVVRKHFTIISYVFVILTLLTIAYTGYAGMQYYLWGNCYGPDADGFCVFDPTGSHDAFSAPELMPTCAVTNEDSEDVASFIADDIPITTPDDDPVVFVGCFNCSYTQKTYPIVRAVTMQENRGFVFAHLPLHQRDQITGRYLECSYDLLGNDAYEFVDLLFVNTNKIYDEQYLTQQLLTFGVQEEQLVSCLESDDTIETVRSLTQTIADAGVYGTPTVYIDDRILVGPKPKRVYERLI
jgi:protein-disulfide isomerase